MTAAPEILPVGGLFQGRWRVVRCIRAGGMGAVYEVVHHASQARCALKVMLPALVANDELRARFRQEMMVTAPIESDHVVRVFDGGTDVATGAPFLVMELLRGQDLAAVLGARGPLPGAFVATLLRQVAFALEKTHAAGIVHRDLKPENLFLTTRDDGTPCIKVLDFGIAKVVAESASRAETTRALGTPSYMAPEQVRGDGTIGPAADLYALAHVAYTLLAGRGYWAREREGGNVYPLLMAIAAGTVEPATKRAPAGAHLPPGFDARFARATALAPEARYPGATEMVGDLALALGVGVPRPRRARRRRMRAIRRSSCTGARSRRRRPRRQGRPGPQAARGRSRSRWVGALAGLVALLAVAVGIGDGVRARSPRGKASHAGVAGPPVSVSAPAAEAPAGSPAGVTWLLRRGQELRRRAWGSRLPSTPSRAPGGGAAGAFRDAWRSAGEAAAAISRGEEPPTRSDSYHGAAR